MAKWASVDAQLAWCAGSEWLIPWQSDQCWFCFCQKNPLGFFGVVSGLSSRPAVVGDEWPWLGLSGNTNWIFCAEVAQTNPFPRGWLICRWFCTWVVPGLCDSRKMERIQTISIPLSVKISLSPLVVPLITSICAASWDIKVLHHPQSISLIPSLKQWSWVLKRKKKNIQQPDRQRGVCFQPQAMKIQAPSSPGGDPPRVVVPHRHSQVLGADPNFFGEEAQCK